MRTAGGSFRLDETRSSSLAAATRGSAPLRVADAAVAVLWFAVAWIVYAGFGLRLAQGFFSEYYNLAFDFDPPRTLQTLALSPADPQGFRHPLIVVAAAAGLAVPRRRAGAQVGGGDGDGDVRRRQRGAVLSLPPHR